MAETVSSLEDLALTWTGRAVDISRIEAELGKLRYMMVGDRSPGDGFALRTSLMNMVVYSERQEDTDMAARVIEDLASYHPSRAMIVQARPEPEESRVDAELAAHCHISRSLEQSVCCEEILLKVAGPAATHLHSVIVPLLVPDLPVYLWWTDQLPTNTHLITELLAVADHLIVDSSRFEDQLEDLVRLSRLTAQETRTGLGDLTWRRLDPWRELFHQQANITEMRHHLQWMRSVEVRYATGGGPPKPAQAFLLLAWLAEELGWNTHTLSAHGAQRLTFRVEEGRQISAYVHSVKYPAVEPGSIVGVKIACQSETASALINVSRTGDPLHVTVRTEHRGGVMEDQVRLDPLELPVMMMAELDAPLRDNSYRDVLRTAVPIIMAIRA